MSSSPSYEQSKQVAEDSREAGWTAPSFGRELFLGNLRLDLIHPQPALPAASVEKGERFLERLRAFLAERVDPAQIERDAKIPDDVLDGLKQLGALGMKIPEEYGGLGLSQVYYNKALALAGTWSAAIGALLSAHQSIGLPEPLKSFGNEEQKREWLPKVAKDHVSAFLLTEPDVGSDPARMACEAVPTDDGTGYRITGTKLWATNGTIADVVVIMAVVPKSDGHKGGITAFICPTDAEGITIKHRNAFMGLRGIENSLTEFKDVFVPNEAVIAGEGKGLRIALATLNVGRLSLPAIAAASTKYALKIAREWSAERKQWGQAVGKHDEVAQHLAFLAGTTFGLEAVVDVSSRIADDGSSDVRIEAALAKLYASELGWTAVDTMVQIRGGRAYETADSLAARGEKAVPAEQLLRDMRINRIFEGSSEIMHLLIAREAVDQHLSVAGDILDPKTELKDKAKAAVAAGRFYAGWLPTLVTGEGQKPTAFEEFGPLAKHVRYVERHSRKLARSTFGLMGRHQASLEQKGALLGRVVDIGAELFAIAAACTYAETIAREEPARADQARELADLFCSQARRRADHLFKQLFSNDDAPSYAAAQRLLDGRYDWLTDDVLDPAGDGPMMPPAVHERAADDAPSEPAPVQ
ncbi:acyl-CoA dehydrogenase family protein [Paraconexibacter antarcticus]|uniref:Acyl-CoA dehydrogenase family protein n=1 Tax=Paraconexibacter antarcticus TaxID=2949664 RepID=A0ABY5DWU7_9ACTN|nr:acyl-CoA dehydrogenase family protein [Paraconexibacter antarcticus]UTI66488.1 acyl-CoA dehydrogenase family protein [Paraconexibacter antarcticus]